MALSIYISTSAMCVWGGILGLLGKEEHLLHFSNHGRLWALSATEFMTMHAKFRATEICAGKTIEIFTRGKRESAHVHKTMQNTEAAIITYIV